jgi:hypothetical protein
MPVSVPFVARQRESIYRQQDIGQVDKIEGDNAIETRKGISSFAEPFCQTTTMKKEKGKDEND